MISIENLHLAIEGKEILKGIDLHLQPGDIYGLLGPNGAGKSTTIFALLGLRAHGSGRISVLGRDPGEHAAAIRSSIGVMPENAGFYEWMTAPAYLRWYGRLCGETQTGKALGLLSAWGVMFAVATPCLWAVGASGQNLGTAVFYLAFFGTPVVLGFGYLAMALSARTGSVLAALLSTVTVLLLAAAGAVAGDGISYWLGHHYRGELRRIWPFARYPGMLQKGEAFFHRHGGKSVLFGRFIGPVRPVIPVVAGMLGMGPLHFSIVNVLSAIGWAFVYILPGVFFGTSLAVAGAVSTRLAVLIFLILATSWVFVWLGRKLVLLVTHHGPIWLAALKGWVAADTTVPWVLLPVKHFFSYLFRRQQGEELFFIFLVLALFVAGWGFLGVLQDVLAKDLKAESKAVWWSGNSRTGAHEPTRRNSG